MSEFIIEPHVHTLLPVHGMSAKFPVRRVYCIGRNYAAHVVEMGGDPNREAPFFFQKNPDDLDLTGQFPYPEYSNEVHHEIELMVALGRGGSHIAVDNGLDYVFGYGVALDMTRRDLQAEAKELRRPWEISKAFDSAAPCGELYSADDVGHLSSGFIELDVNGEIRQSGDLNQMVWKVPEIIAYLSCYFELAAGDVIMTGTPSGVGPVKRGDVMNAMIEGLDTITVTVI